MPNSPAPEQGASASRQTDTALTPPPEMDAAELGRASGAILRTGLMMLAAGTASYRVKQGMKAVAKSLGVEQHSEQVTLTEIATTSRVGQLFRTEVSELRVTSVNADRIALLDRLRRDLPARSTPGDVHRSLDVIERRGVLYPRWANAVFAGMACSGFAILNRARLLEVIAVLVAATMGQLLRRALAERHFNVFGITIAAAAAASGVYIGLLAGLDVMGTGIETHASGYISSVLFLLPGFALITGALDMAKLDFSAGVSRVAYGTMLTLGAAASVWALSLLSPLDTSPRPPIDVPIWASIGISAIATWVGVLGFALLFNSPWRMALIASLIGLANVPRLLLIDSGMAIQTATMLACLTVGVLAAFAARGGRWPHITLSVPAVLVQIPGVTAHEAVVSLNEARYLDAVSGILQVTLTVLAILVGLVVAKLLTDKEWAFERA